MPVSDSLHVIKSMQQEFQAAGIAFKCYLAIVMYPHITMWTMPSTSSQVSCNRPEGLHSIRVNMLIGERQIYHQRIWKGWALRSQQLDRKDFQQGQVFCQRTLREQFIWATGAARRTLFLHRSFATLGRDGITVPFAITRLINSGKVETYRCSSIRSAFGKDDGTALDDLSFTCCGTVSRRRGVAECNIVDLGAVDGPAQLFYAWCRDRWWRPKCLTTQVVHTPLVGPRFSALRQRRAKMFMQRP